MLSETTGGLSGLSEMTGCLAAPGSAVDPPVTGLTEMTGLLSENDRVERGGVDSGLWTVLSEMTGLTGLSEMTGCCAVRRARMQTHGSELTAMNEREAASTG